MSAIRIISSVLFLGLASAAVAGEEDRVAGGRYTMQPIDGGMLRLDTETGAISLCTGKSGQWSCEPVGDTSSNTTEKIAKLEMENRELKDRVRTLEQSAAGKDPTAPSAGDGGRIQLPTEQEVDQAFDYAERIFRKLKDRFEKLGPPPKPNGGSL